MKAESGIRNLVFRIQTSRLFLLISIQFATRTLFLSFFILISLIRIYAQSYDNSASDSLDKAFQKQVNANNVAAGLDTVILPVNSDFTVKTASDTSHTPVLQHTKVNTHMRKFYWNPDKANLDSLDRKKYRHSPFYAAIFSAALPGLGQAYNRKYWKIPIVYAGFAGLGYAIYYTGSNFSGYRHAYRLQVDNNLNTYGSYKGVDDAAALKDYRDYFKKNLDISAICTAVWYVLNIVDAAVDAHLFEWNMKDDLNLSWQPTAITGTADYPQAAVGIKLNLNF